MLKKTLGALALTTFLVAPAFADKPDSWVTTKTKLALWTASDIDSTEIMVDSVDGAVTLYGKVETPFAKAKAERVAKKIEGAKTVRNLIQVVPGSRSKIVARADKEIQDAVQKALKNDDMLKNSSVDVRSVDKGVVLLGGTVTDAVDELAAVRDAIAVEGVKRVATEIKGGDKMGDRMDVMAHDTKAGAQHAERKAHDGWLTTEVKMALIAEADVPATQINVDTRGDNVTLFGMVPTAAAKAAAENAAKKVDGVRSVDNQLAIVPKSAKKMVAAKDDDIKKSLKQAFGRRQGLASVDVDVKGGIVRLTGTVPSTYQKLEAAVVSRTTAGVRSVSSDLQIKSKN